MNRQTTTTRGQRIAIWVMAILMLGGTIAGLVFAVFATQNSKVDPNTIAQEEFMDEYQKQYEEYLKMMEEQRKKFRGLDGYADYINEFSAESVTTLTTETLKDGDGATISQGDSIKVNYTGWTPNGKIFDSTKSEGVDAEPAVLDLDNLVAGWSEGLVGKKAGGVYLLSLPADKGYGDTGSNDGSIKPGDPIKFIVEVISIEKN